MKCRESLDSRIQVDVDADPETPSCRLEKDKVRASSSAKGGFEPIFIPNEGMAKKLIRHTHQQFNHLVVANIMSAIRVKWWIPRLRSKVKKVINRCNLCKVFRAKPYGTTANFPTSHRK